MKQLEIDVYSKYDCIMIGIEAFSPVNKFMNKHEIKKVLNEWEFNNSVWSIPIILPISENENIELGKDYELIYNNEVIATINVESEFNINKNDYCKKLFKYDTLEHPGVKIVHNRLEGKKLISGNISNLNMNIDVFDNKLVLTPKQLKEYFKKNNIETPVAYQTRNALHSVHEHMISEVLKTYDTVFITPVINASKPGEFDLEDKIKIYDYYINNVFKSLNLHIVPMNQTYAGPREGVHNMIIRQNYGFKYYVAGRDKNGVGNYYGLFESIDKINEVSDKLDIELISFPVLFWCSKCKDIQSYETCPHDIIYHNKISATIIREKLKNKESVEEWLMRPEIVKLLMK